MAPHELRTLGLRTAKLQRSHWHEQYKAALASGDAERAGDALKCLREYDWLVRCLQLRLAANRDEN
jgi:hypothetical protein